MVVDTTGPAVTVVDALSAVGGVGQIRRFRPREYRLTVPVGRLVDVAKALRVLPSRLRLFTMVAADERETAGTFTLSTVFADDRTGTLLTLETPVDPVEAAFPSITPVFPAANWSEREIQDLFGLTPIGHPDRRRLVLHGNWPRGIYPLRKDADLRRVPFDRPALPNPPLRRMEGEGVVDIPVGPIHAGVIEPGHFRFSAVGEVVYHLEARLFYVHRGIEKLCEGRSAEAVLPIAERICGACAFTHATAYCRAIETILGVEPPPRAQAIRSLFLELERLYNHIGDVGNLCAGVGFAVGTSQGARLKEVLMALNEAVAGNRWLRGVNRIGGVRRDLSAETVKLMRETLGYVEREFLAVTELIRQTDSVIERFAGAGILTPDVARDLGAVGVAARASGQDIDARRDLPFAPESSLRLRVPIHQGGDVLARALVRVDEVFVSFRLLRDLLDGLPTGSIGVSTGPLPPHERAMGWAESPRGEAVHWVLTGADGTISRYRIRSASYANWPVVPSAAPGNMVPDFPLINKSFELCYSCCDR